MRKYTKDKSHKEDRSVVVHKKDWFNDEESFDVGNIGISSKYQKSEGYIEPKVFVVIFMGGTDREPNYFKIITGPKTKHLFSNIKVESFPSNYNPKKIFEEYAVLRVENYVSSMSKEHPDSFYFIVDVDDFRGELLEIKPKCEKIDLNLIISNPCFEVWLYYSERSDKFESFPYPTEDNPQLSQNVKFWLGNESGIKGGIKTTKAIFNIRRNIENARNNYDIDNDGIPSLFSTNMFELAEEILPYIEDDLKNAKALSDEKKSTYLGNKI